MGPIGGQEMVAIVLIALLLFGPKKLPELGRLLGKGLTEFRRAKNELKSTFEGHMRELEREANVADAKEKSKWEPPAPAASSSTYDQPYSYNGWDENGPSASYEPSEPAQPVPAIAPAPEPVTGTVARSSAPPPAKEENHAA